MNPLRDVRAWLMLLVLALLWIAATIHRGEPLAWDELEFFRATRWVAEGKVPYRDYWEHHTPLQWLLFAPVAGVFGDGAGASSVLAMRWAQIPVWIGTFLLMIAISRREGTERWARWCAVVMLLAAPAFARGAAQYRLDVLGTLAFIAAFAVGSSTAGFQPAREGGAGRMPALLERIVRSPYARWIAFGALMSLSVLANLRLAPLVILAGALALFWRAGERRWALNPRALWMSAGVAATAALFVVGLFATGAWDAFVEGVIRYNIISDRLFPPGANTFVQRLLAPFVARDIAAIVFWLAGLTGLVLALRDIARPGALQILAILVLASLAAIAAAGVQYPYHFQTVYILLIPLVGLAVSRLAPKWRFMTAVVAAVALLVNLVPLAGPGYGNELRYQDLIMKSVHRVTSEREVVWEGVGYAIHRQPAYRYWFLPAGVRMMAQAGYIEPYEVREITARPPGAIIYNLRVHYWMETFPRLGSYVYRHYVPLYRNLWIPGMSTVVGPEIGLIRHWTVPRTGRYTVWSSELLVKHPWFARPIDYGLMDGEAALDLQIPLKRLTPLPGQALSFRVDGIPVKPGTTMLDLRAGSRLDLNADVDRPAGVFVIPAGIDTLCTAPPERFVF